MLSNLRPGSPVFVIYRNGPRVITARVVQLSSQYPPQVTFPMQPGAQNFSPMFDMNIEIDGKTELFQKIPINTSIAEYPDRGIIISETKDGVENEIRSIYNLATGELDKRQHYEQLAANCQQILMELHPEQKRDKERDQEIATMKKQVEGMNEKVAKMMGMMEKMLGTNTQD